MSLGIKLIWGEMECISYFVVMKFLSGEDHLKLRALGQPLKIFHAKHFYLYQEKSVQNHAIFILVSNKKKVRRQFFNYFYLLNSILFYFRYENIQ